MIRIKHLILFLLLCTAGYTQAQVRLEVTPNGWAIVDSDNADLVLAYGEGSVDPNHMAPFMASYIEAANQALPSIRHGIKRKAQYKNIPDILTCKWAQADPFNRRTPVFQGHTDHTLTGCVATAFAQVFYHHKLPTQLAGVKKYSYTSDEGLTGANGSSTITITEDLSTLTIDWGNLIDKPWNRNTGKADCTEAQGDAVATLMYLCGLISDMHYGYHGSGASVDWSVQGINAYIKGLKAEHVSFNEDVILNELSNGNPVVYSGGGHCFVIDGANANGYLHCNLGWGGGGEVREDGTVGSGDGYYLPTVMAGYINGQSIVRVWKDGTGTPYVPPVLPPFNNSKTYTLRNTGYSQGYLVATSQDDTHPTLRGVTTNHANGLFPGAAYRESVDMSSWGTFWTITTEGDKQYLKNSLTGKYLTNSGDRTAYVFTSTKTPIHITQNADGTYCFNTGVHSESYLCAATQLENPAAFWTSDDKGSIWTVTEAEPTNPGPGPGPGPGPEPEPETFDALVDNVSDFSAAEKYTLFHARSKAVVVVENASDEHAVVRGTDSSRTGGLENYYLAADLTSSFAQWKVTPSASKPWVTIYNIGAQKYLAFTGDGYTLSASPYNIYLEDKGENVFTINWGQGLSSSGVYDYMVLALAQENPLSHSGASARDERYWSFNKVNTSVGLGTTLRAPAQTSSYQLNPFVRIVNGHKELLH